MPKLQALELVPDDEGQLLVRRDWQALHDAGLPSQLDHHGSTNAPHVTVVSATALPSRAIDEARTGLGEVLPVLARASGLLVLGGERVTIARAVDVDDDVVRRVLALREQVPDRQHVGWLPHVTLARRVPRTEVQRALDVLGHADVVLALTELRHWDPVLGRVTTVAAGG
ncbi:MAG: 2'-5' RNA ligase family protein [Nocardioidaceae bacterium]